MSADHIDAWLCKDHLDFVNVFPLLKHAHSVSPALDIFFRVVHGMPPKLGVTNLGFAFPDQHDVGSTECLTFGNL
jgi:hypothetical protein